MPKFGDGGDLLKCSFCGKSQKQVKKLIAGPGVYICDECIDLCNEIIEEELTESPELKLEELPKPREIYEFLKDYVVGQEQAKKILSVAVYNHYKRIQADNRRDGDVELQKSNILLLGPTGCGKTLLAQTLAKMLNVPFAIADATASVPPQGGRKHPHQEFIQIDTSNILFICGGAFAGLEKIIESRIGARGIGFGGDVRKREDKDIGTILAQVLPEDLLKYGLIPEFVGRLPVISFVHNLDRQALIEILTKPKNALVKQFKKVLEYDGVELAFSEDALAATADLAMLRGTGARGLRAIMEEVLLDVMYDLPSRKDVGKCLIDKDTVLEKVNPTLVPRTAERPKRPERGERSA